MRLLPALAGHALLVGIALVRAQDAAPPADSGSTGGWHAIELTKDTVTRFTTALTNEYNYRATVKHRVCLYTFDKVYAQDFATGTNYQFHGLACRIASATDSGLCHAQMQTYELCAMHDIRIYEQAGTVNATQVLKIDVLDGSPPSDVEDVLRVNESTIVRAIAPSNNNGGAAGASSDSASSSMSGIDSSKSSPGSSLGDVEQHAPLTTAAPEHASLASSADANHHVAILTMSAYLAAHLAQS